MANFLVDYRLNGANAPKVGLPGVWTASAATTALLASGRSSLTAQINRENLKSSSLSGKMSVQAGDIPMQDEAYT